MALVTKKYLYEAIASLISGGSPSTGKKFEPRMVQAHLQQVINRKLKTEYLSATLPSDETIPEGLVLACYNDIPVGPYKGLSRAKLPAMPISLRRNMGVYFVGPAAGGNTPVPDAPTSAIVTISTAIGVSTLTTGTTDLVSGLEAGSSIVTCNALAGKLVNIIRGNTPIPRIDPGDGSNYFTKAREIASITFSTPLVLGEFIQIQTTDE